MSDLKTSCVYVDSSVLLRFVLNEDKKWRQLPNIRSAITSELTKVECFRTIDRLRLKNQLDDEQITECRELVSFFLQRTEVILLTSEILETAAHPLPTTVRTLDALHLCSAVLWQKMTNKHLLFVTHDEQQAMGARALGLEVDGV